MFDRQGLQTLREIVGRTKVAMLTTQDAEGDIAQPPAANLAGR